jgi:hypothetical protein
VKSFSLCFCLALLAACNESGQPTAPSDSGPPQGFGTAVIDGNVRDGEWTNASVFQVFEQEPRLAGSVLYVMNDATNLYVGLRTTDNTVIGPATTFGLRFDNTGDGIRGEGDDQVSVHPSGFYDRHIEQGSYEFDSQVDGLGAMMTVDGVVHVELSRPLSTGDPDDASLAPGGRVPICVSYSMADYTLASTPQDCRFGQLQNYLEIELAAN